MTKTLSEKVEELFKKEKDIPECKRAIENARIVMVAKIDEQNKALQEKIDLNNATKKSPN